jgi:hypothetical protein
MKHLSQLFLGLIFIFSIQTASAQTMKVTGTVYDTTGVKPLQNAMIMAVRVKDSLLLGFTRSDSKGVFNLTGFDADTFSLVIAHPNFDDRTYYIFGNKDNFEINIPTVKMTSKAKELQEVIIYANKNPIYYKGDTLVYVADSFKVAEGAVVEDLLKKLPGIKIDKEGKITSQGQEINKVLVDGDEFFGTDPTVATKNLAADGIQTVQIYEKTDSETIGGSDAKIKVLDLKLKDSAKKGYFGRVSGASDLFLTPGAKYIGGTPFYEGELLFNKFDSKQKISVFALGSNTPRSNFGRGDLNKFGLSNESGANGNFWEADNNNNNGGIPQTFKAGIYFSDKFGKKQNTDLLFNYSYYNDRIDSRTSEYSQYFLTDTTYNTEDSTRYVATNESHNLNLKITSQVDSLTLIEFKPSVSFDSGYTDNTETSVFRGETGIQSLSTQIGNINDSKGIKVNNTVRLYRKFMKKRRELEIRYDLVLSKNTTDGSLYSKSDYSLLGIIDTIDQKKINNNSSTSHYATTTYYEPLSKFVKLNINYLFEYGVSNQDKIAYDKLNGEYTEMRQDLSNNFDNTRVQNRVGTELIYEKGKHFISGGAFFRNINIDNNNLTLDTVINQNINNVLPKFKYEYKPSVSKRMSINYRTSSQQPSINDLQPILDNSNPNRIQEGNANLKPNYVHSLDFSFNNWNALSGKYFWSGASMNITDNAFASETNFNQYGQTVTKTINVDGNFSANVYAGGGLPILDRVIEFNPSLSGAYNKYKSVVSGAENTTENYVLTPGLDIDFEWDSLEISLTSSYSYNNPVSSLSSASNTPFSTQEYGIGVKWTLPAGFIIKADGNYTKNSQPGAGFYDTEFFILDAEINKKFLKTGNLVVAVIGNDILNQNISASRTVNGNTITDNRTTIISRYFLLKVTYRFNNRKMKEDDFRGMH